MKVAKLSIENDDNFVLGSELRPGMMVQRVLSNGILENLLLIIQGEYATISYSCEDDSKKVFGTSLEGIIHFIKINSKYKVIANKIRFN